MINIRKEPGVVFLILLFFCFSLDVQAPISFYGTQFVGLSLLVIIRFIFFPRISKNCLKLLVFNFLFFEAFCFIQNLYIKQEILVLIYQKVVFLLSVVILLYDFISRVNIHILKRALAIYISFMSIIVFAQFIGFYFLGLDRSLLDFGILLGGEESRTWYFGNFGYRPTGITSEPAIFVGVQFGLLAIQYLVDRGAQFSRILGIISISLSMSFLGLILSALFLIIVYSKNIKNYLFSILSLIIFSLFAVDLIDIRVRKFLEGDDGSNNVKIEAVKYFLSSPEITLLGYGFLFPSKGSPQFYDALLDLTFYLNTLTIFGVVLGLFILYLFIYLLFKTKTSFKEKFLIILSLVKLSNPSVLFFSCFMLFCIIVLKKRETN